MSNRVSKIAWMLLMSFASVGLIAPATFAQDEPEKATDSPPPVEATDERSIEEIMQDLERDDPEPAPTPVTEGEDNSLSTALFEHSRFQTAARPGKGRLLPEGSVIISHAAIMHRSPVMPGMWEIVLDPGERQREPIRMLALPNRILERVEQTMGTTGGMASMTVSGRVFVYKRANYIMLTVPPRNIVALEVPATDQEAQSTGNATADDRSVSWAPTPETAAASGPRANRFGRKQGDDYDHLRPEGSFIMSRRGRLDRTGGSGHWLFVFESDELGTADPPVVVLPCALLERMEQRAQATGDASEFIMSGEIYTYGQMNYLLPDRMVIPYARYNLTP